MFLWNLGASSISVRSDEVIYVRIAQSIVHHGDLFPLLHGNVPTYEKPFLKFWLSALPMLALGDSNWSFRILDGLLGIATILITAALSNSMSRSTLVALMSAALLLAMPEVVIAQHSFRHAVLDSLLSFLTIVGVFYSWKLANRECITPRHSLILGAVWGAAVLTKSVAGIVPAVCSLVAILAARINTGTSKRLLIRPLIWIVAVPLMVFFLYACALWFVGGSKALRVFLGIEILDRAFGGFSGHNTGSRWFYIWYLFERGGAVPRALLVSGLLGALVTFRERSHMRFLLVWALVPVGMYSCAASRTPWYLLPYFPSLSIVSVLGVLELARLLRDRVSYYGAFTFLALVAFLSAPPFYRSLVRNIDEVISDTSRIPIDIAFEKLRGSHSKFVIVEDAVSGRSNPRKGRFNVEGIYRETLRPNLRAVKRIQELRCRTDEVLLVRESSLPVIPPGWIELQRLAPSVSRPWAVIAISCPDGLV
jgi:4-amino-4-deoxy-L-arabinose transferase-like glycosyltransferase